MNKSILVSLAIIGIVGAVVTGVTISYFSDTEVSKGNTFTAGTIDIVLDDVDQPFLCETIVEQGKCNQPRCYWDDADGRCKRSVNWTDGVTGTWDTPEDWNPGDLWNAYISIHNNGNKDIKQILFYASDIDDSDDGLNPESEPADNDGTGGGDLMSDDIYFWGAEEFVWPSETYQNNVALVYGDGRCNAVNAFNTLWGTDISCDNDGATDAFHKALAKLGLGNEDLIPEEVDAIVDLINFAYQVALTSENFDQSTFVAAFDTDAPGDPGYGRADLDEFDGKNTAGGQCSKNVLFPGEILEPCAVKILVIHWMFDINASNNLQGDRVEVEFSFNAIQDGVEPQEILCGI